MRRGFTLVEVLVTVAIIAALTALMLPAWHIVQARANSVKCVANLNSLGIALQGYLADHNNTLPTLQPLRASVNDQVPVIDNTLNAYTTDQRIFACPADPNLAAKTGTSYYWDSNINGQHVGSLSLKMLTIVLTTQSSQIPIILDKQGWHQYTANKVNMLFADGHEATQLNFFSN